VTHLDVDRAGVERAAKVLSTLLSSGQHRGQQPSPA
jgi:hypothetical protein